MPGETTTETDFTKTEAYKKLVQGFVGLGQVVTELGKQVKKQGEDQGQFLSTLNEIRDSVKGGKKRGKKRVRDEDEDLDGETDDDNDDDDELSEEDMDGMSQSQLFKLMVKEVSKVVDKKVKSVSDQVTNLGKSVQSKAASSDVREFHRKNPDLLEWKEEIAELAKEEPKLSLRRMYAIVKAENPEKASKLSKKYKGAKVEEDDQGRVKVTTNDDGEGGDDDQNDLSFFGIQPQGGSKSGGKTPEGRMTPKQAAEDAWEKTMAKLSPALIGED